MRSRGVIRTKHRHVRRRGNHTTAGLMHIGYPAAMGLLQRAKHTPQAIRSWPALPQLLQLRSQPVLEGMAQQLMEERQAVRRGHRPPVAERALGSRQGRMGRYCEAT